MKATKRSRNSNFQQGSGTYTCRDCGKHTRETGDGESSVELCRRCYDAAGDENGISDAGGSELTPEAVERIDAYIARYGRRPDGWCYDADGYEKLCDARTKKTTKMLGRGVATALTRAINDTPTTTTKQETTTMTTTTPNEPMTNAAARAFASKKNAKIEVAPKTRDEYKSLAPATRLRNAARKAGIDAYLTENENGTYTVIALTPKPKKAAKAEPKSKAAKAHAGQKPKKAAQLTARPKSLLDHAADALAKSSEPLNCKQMVAAAYEAGWTTNGKTPEATLSAAILRESRKETSRFEKAGRGLYTRAA